MKCDGVSGRKNSSCKDTILKTLTSAHWQLVGATLEQRHLVAVWMPVLCLDIIAMLTQHELCYIFSMHSYNSADLLQRRVSNIISFRILNLKISLMMKPAEVVISTPPRDLSRPSIHPLMLIAARCYIYLRWHFLKLLSLELMMSLNQLNSTNAVPNHIQITPESA